MFASTSHRVAPSAVLTPKSSLNSVPSEEYQGAFQPMGCLYGFEVCQWGTRDQGEGSVAGMQVRERAQVIDNHGATGAAGRWPAINTRRKHEVADDELASSLEQVEEGDLAVWSIET
jgi:hypothetical protein